MTLDRAFLVSLPRSFPKRETRKGQGAERLLFLRGENYVRQKNMSVREILLSSRVFWLAGSRQ